MKKAKLLSLIAASTMVFSISGCKRSTTDVFKTTYGTDPMTFNAAKVNDQPSSMHLTNFIDGLVENNNRGALVPALATSWTPSAVAGGKQKWVFNLRENVKWRVVEGGKLVDFKVNDQPVLVSAQDWVTTGKYILDPRNASEVVYLWWMFIDGAETYYNDLDKVQVCNTANPTTQAGLATRYSYECDSIGAGETAENAIQKVGTVYSYKVGGSAKTDYVAPSFDSVGVKQGADPLKLEFTLSKEMNYFPTVLTYSAFLPTNQQFVNLIGGIDNYGIIDTAPQEKLAYNGAYYLSSYASQSQIIYKANPSYWDKEHVYIKEVRMLYIPDDAGPGWAREQYEAGNIDGFRVAPTDVAGTEQYVKGGANGTGTEANPAHENAYVTTTSGNGSVYFLRWNFDRPDKDDIFGSSSLSEIENFEAAMQNRNFRKALFYSVNRSAYNSRYTVNPDQWTYTSFVPNGLVYDSTGKDYTEYFQEKVAEKIAAETAGASPAVVPATFAAGVGAQTQASVFSPALAKFYMQKALTDWGYATLAAPGSTTVSGAPTLPVKFNVTFAANASLTAIQNSFVGSINESINLAYDETVAPAYAGHAADAPLVYASLFTSSSTNVSEKAFYADNFSAYVSGWGPDYGDPTTFMNTFKPNGDFASRIGLETADALPGYSEYADEIAAADLLTNLADRYEAFAEAEFTLLFELSLLVPMFQPYQGTDVRVGKVQPFCVQKAIYGNSADKIKGLKILSKPLTKETFAQFKTAYDAGN